ncbi:MULTISPECIES: SDR family oxidoreductase [Subtercola]|uniref:SDR family oxidoreductase n=1 Tax=Subtercola vilae TaxID=2056433 RepID=A0A4T2C525_9MICO|nr:MULTISPECIES: SDR family oxidoreductase [Subtercola]MEA9984143.1 SDR family oxidoreductase [Subtercola sp. RTI3]TIH38642.1 SDR family oxidoreductase [Subtercola vilae]
MAQLTTSPGRALIVGATGIIGQTAGRQLADLGWEAFGLSRSGALSVPGVTSVTADLLDPESLATALAGTRPDIVFITAWMRNATEAENIRVNSAMVRNVLAALEPEKSVKHVALLTGLKHYLGPFDNYATGVMADTPFHEDEPRLDSPNFYYAQEDELFASAEKNGYTWSVHRAHTVFGYAVGNAMNMVLTLSVYATICKELGLVFTFPGSETQWNGVTDVTDADLLGEQLIWASTHPEGQNEAFNIANGDVFRWRWLWPRLANIFGVEWAGFEGEPRPLADQMAGMEDTWKGIADRYDLVESDLTKLASWWHSDGDLGRNIECLTDMSKSRKAGFLNFRATPDSFTDKLERYRAARILP